MTGTISKRPRKNGGVAWSYTFDAGRDEAGKRIQKTKSGFATKRECSDALRVAIATAEAERNAPPVAALPTFQEFFDRWMREHAARRCSPKTVERYGELGRYAIAHLGASRLNEIGPVQIEMMINALRDSGGLKSKQHPAGRPLSPKTVRHIACVAHECFEKGVIWRMLDRNSMDGVDLPKLEKRQPVVLDKGKITVLFDRARGTRLFPFVVLAASTGARRGELLALTWSDFDFETGVMTLSKSLEQTKAGLRVKSTKSGKPRKFTVPLQAVGALKVAPGGAGEG